MYSDMFVEPKRGPKTLRVTNTFSMYNNDVQYFIRGSGISLVQFNTNPSKTGINLPTIQMRFITIIFKLFILYIYVGCGYLWHNV